MVLVTSRESDLSRRPGALPFRFSVEGTDYWIDLTQDEIDAFEDAVNPFVAAARTTDPDAPPRRRKTSESPATGPSKSAVVRAWARSQGLAVNARGKVPAVLEAAYDGAHTEREHAAGPRLADTPDDGPGGGESPRQHSTSTGT